MRNRAIGVVILCLLAVLLGGCGQQEAVAPEGPPETPPPVYRVRLETTKGDIAIEVHQEWAPHGADHFYYLVRQGFYDGVRFHRVVRRFVAQFGINPNPQIESLYAQMTIPDDPVVESNTTGYVTFAKTELPDSRTTQVFINLKDNSSLDKDGFAPFGQVVEGMENVERLWSSYGEVAPRGTGPDPTRIEIEGDAYLDREFPRLDTIVRARIELVEIEAPGS